MTVIDRARLKKQIAIVDGRWKLTPRQREVLELVARGTSNSEIARELEISERTVEVHLTAIFTRARCNSRAELIAVVWAASA